MSSIHLCDELRPWKSAGAYYFSNWLRSWKAFQQISHDRMTLWPERRLVDSSLQASALSKRV